MVTTRLYSLGCLMTMIALAVAPAAAAVKIPTRLICGPLSLYPAHNARFSTAVMLFAESGRLSGQRTTSRRPGREMYSGRIATDGAITVRGRGAFFDRKAGWRLEFNGKANRSGRTVLHGTLQALATGAKRKCSLVLNIAGDQLLAQVAETPTKEAKKEADVPAAASSNTPPKVSSAATAVAESPPASQPGKAATAAKTASTDTEKPAASPSAQKPAPASEQATKSEPPKQMAGSDTVNWIQNTLGGVVLPTGENAEDWVSKIAAVPSQEQQFCRIIDRFHDDLARALESRNQIKVNAVYRERQRDLATLLHDGEFQNWIVRVEEVRQGPDGAVGITLQPPCRAVLSAYSCEKSGAIQASIPANSPAYEQLSKISHNDFVAISGKLLSIAAGLQGQPLATTGGYRAAIDCSQPDQARGEKIFGTRLNSLFQIQ